MSRREAVERASSRRVQFLFRWWSRVYDSALFQTPFFHRVHQKILAGIDRADPRSVLDVGCGTGELLVQLTRRWPGARHVGLDLSSDMLSRGRAKPARGVALIQGSVYDLPFADGAFDLITNSISSHFYLDFGRALGELRRVCAPDGRLAMASLGNSLLRHVPGPWRREIRVPEGAYRAPEHQRRALERAGFAVESVAPAVGLAWLYLCRAR